MKEKINTMRSTGIFFISIQRTEAARILKMITGVSYFNEEVAELVSTVSDGAELGRGRFAARTAVKIPEKIEKISMRGRME